MSHIFFAPVSGLVYPADFGPFFLALDGPFCPGLTMVAG